MGLFDSLKKLTEDVVDIAVTPVKIAVDTTRVVTKPVADIAKDIAKEVEETVDEITED